MTDGTPIDVATLLAAARRPHDLRTRALAGAIGTAAIRGCAPLIRGLSEARFQKLVNEYFPLAGLHNGRAAAPCDDEFKGVLALLLEHRAEPSEEAAWLAHAVASAAMGRDTLWRDMGLEDGEALSRLMQENFPALAAANPAGTKWKTFFHRRLGELAGMPACDLSHCDECCAQAECFGGDER